MQIGAQVEAHEKEIAELRESIQVAREKQATEKEKVKKLKKDMDEFKNNKEGKIEELKVGLLNTQDMTLLTPFAG